MPISDGTISSRQLCTGSVENRHIQPGAVGPIEIESGYNFIQVVSVLPSGVEGDMAYLTTDNKLYRHDGGAWILAVDGADITDATIAGDKMIANTITAGEIAAATITGTELAALNLTVGKHIRSTTYTPGSAGWSIDADGTAEFDSVTVRGTIEASSIEGNVTLGTGGVFRTAASGARVEMDVSTTEFIDFYDATGKVAQVGYKATPFADFTIEAVNGNTVRIASGHTGGDGVIHLDAGPGTGGIGSSVRVDADGQIKLSSAQGSTTIDGDIFFEVDPSNTVAEIIFHTRGNLRMTIESTGQVRITKGIEAQNGSVSLPTYSFYNDPDTGIYWVGSGRLGFTLNGTHVAEFNGGKLRSATVATGSPEILLGSSTGSSGAPVYSFQGDSNTGMWRGGADWVSFAGGGHHLWAMLQTDTGGTVWLAPRGDTTDRILFASGVNQWQIAIASTTEMILGSTGFQVPNVFNTDQAGGSTVYADSDGRLHINTSILAHKENVAAADVAALAAIDLTPYTFTKDGHPGVGFIADYLAAQDSRLGVYQPKISKNRDRYGRRVQLKSQELIDYETRGVLAVLAAKIITLEARVATLEAA